MTFTTCSVRPGLVPAVRTFLGPYCAVDSPFRAYWTAFLDGCESGRAEAVVALDGAAVAGLAVIQPRPMTPQGGRSIIHLPDPDRESAAYDALVPAVDLWLQERGLGEQCVVVPDRLKDRMAPLLARGFVRDSRMVSFRTPTDAPPRPEVAGVRIVECSAEACDEALLVRLSEFCGRGLTRREIVAPTDLNGVRALLSVPGVVWLVAVEEATGRVVGAAEVMPADGFFSFVAIARAYWGSGLADRLGWAVLHRLAADGVREALSAARVENSASIALHARFNAVRVEESEIHYRPAALGVTVGTESHG